ncbi:MAG: MarR family transcriptional regulator [Nocardioides sp.]
MDPRDIDLPTLTSLAGNGVVRRVLADLAGEGYAGVRVSHGYLFQRLLDTEPTITELAESLGMTQQGASKQVRELEELGFVERRPVSGDGRVRCVRLTERGRGVVDAGRRARAALEAEVVDMVGARDVRAAREVLAALLEVTGLGDDVRTRRVPLPPPGL